MNCKLIFFRWKSNGEFMLNKLIVLLLIISPLVHARGDKGHGGFAYLCGLQTELIDLEEINLISGLNTKLQMINSDEEVFTQALKALEKLDSADSEVFQSASKKLEKIRLGFENFNSLAKWNIPLDLGAFPDKAGCSVENIVNYFDDYHIELDRKLYNALVSKTHQAALWVHEILYSLARDEKRSGQIDSLSTRRTVAYLFSNLDRPELLLGLIKGFLSLKSSVGAVMYLPTNEVNKVIFHHEVYLQDNNKSFFGLSRIIVDKTNVSPKKIKRNHKETFIPWKEFSLDLNPKVTTVEIETPFYGISGTSVRAKSSTKITYDSQDFIFHQLHSGLTGENKVSNYYGVFATYTFIPGIVMDYIYGEL